MLTLVEIRIRELAADFFDDLDVLKIGGSLQGWALASDILDTN